MKRTYYGIIIVLILALLVGMGTYTVKKETAKMFEILNKIETSVYQDKPEEAANLTKQAEEIWVDSEKKLKIYINHADISDVGLTIAGMVPLIEQGDTGEFMSLFKQLKIQLIHISSMENVRCD